MKTVFLLALAIAWLALGAYSAWEFSEAVSQTDILKTGITLVCWLLLNINLKQKD